MKAEAAAPKRVKKQLADVVRIEGHGYQLRPSKTRRGTFLIEATDEPGQAIISGLSKHAAEHYVATLRHLKDRRRP